MRASYTAAMLDATRINEILDADHDYYAKCAIAYEHVGRLVPSTADLLDRALEGAEHVLDIGCGRADTLRRNARRFSRGVGVDDDLGRLDLARRELRQAIVDNITLV